MHLPYWLGLGDLGQGFLQLSLCLLALQFLLGTGLWSGFGKVLSDVVIANMAVMFLAMAVLVAAHVQVDLHLLNVAQNSNRNAPLLYRIAGAWGNHEGSLLLWLLWMALSSMLLLGLQRKVPSAAPLLAKALAVQAGLQLLLTSYALIFSNPFIQSTQPAVAGMGLNPLLQDVGLAMHPPLLYLGLTGLSLPFALAMAALWMGGMAQDWARLSRLCVVWAWGWMTLGVALGSWWAYRELGWGGWWFWDPVENAALVPWLLATAMLHGLRLANSAKGRDRVWEKSAQLMAIFACVSTLLAMFLVRSGLLTSVHAFALDPARGTVLLLMTGVVLLTSLTLFLWRSSTRLAAEGAAAVPTKLSFQSPAAWLLIAHWLFALLGGVVLLGTAYPLLVQAVGGSPLAVAGDFYQMVVVPLFLLLLLGLNLLPYLEQGKRRLRRGIMLGKEMLALTVLASGALWLGYSWLAGGLIAGLGAGVIIGHWPLLGPLLGSGGRKTARRAGQRQLMVVAHLAVGLAVIAMAISSFYQQSYTIRLAPGQSALVGRYRAKLVDLREVAGVNYQAWQANISLTPAVAGGRALTFTPEKRKYVVEGMVTSEAAIDYGFWRDVYVVMGQPDEAAGRLTFKVMINPLMSWLWAASILASTAALVTAAKGFFRLSDAKG
jgi:cytochrome c-type biogenesis protein CcmF